jgi:hypothetical protein
VCKGGQLVAKQCRDVQIPFNLFSKGWDGPNMGEKLAKRGQAEI